MCRRISAVFLLLVFLPHAFCLEGDSFAVTSGQLETMLEQVQKIRQESGRLKIQLSALNGESQRWQAQLKTLDTQLVRSEKKLKKAALSLQISKAELIKLKKEISQLNRGLEELKKRVQKLNRQLARSKRWNKILIGVAAVLAAGSFGAGFYLGGR